MNERTASYGAYGAAVEVRGPGPLVDEVERRFPPVPAGPGPVSRPEPAPPRRFHIVPGSADGSYDVREDGDTTVVGASPGAAVHRVEADAKLWISSRAREVVFVHAGVVGLDGRALVLPGHSHAGKTTLVEALIREGATYYSDDYAVVSPDGRVWPWAIPLAVRGPGGIRDLVPPERIGARVGVEGLPLGWVIVTRYAPGARFAFDELTPAATAVRMMVNAPAGRLRAGEVMAALAAAVEGARGFEGDRGDAAGEAARMVGMLLAARGP